MAKRGRGTRTAAATRLYFALLYSSSSVWAAARHRAGGAATRCWGPRVINADGARPIKSESRRGRENREREIHPVGLRRVSVPRVADETSVRSGRGSTSTRPADHAPQRRVASPFWSRAHLVVRPLSFFPSPFLLRNSALSIGAPRKITCLAHITIRRTPCAYSK